MVPINPGLLYLQLKRVRGIQERHKSSDHSDIPPFTWKDDKCFLIGWGLFSISLLSFITYALLFR